MIWFIYRRKSTSQTPQQSPQPNIYSLTPSAPPLEIVYDSRTEDVRVQDSVHNDVYPGQEENVSGNTTDVNTQD
jgi:hypothetical protein